MAITSVQWSIMVVLAAVCLLYATDMENLQHMVVGFLRKAGTAEVPQVKLHYNVTVRDNSGNAQNFIYNHTVEAARIAAAVKDTSSRVSLVKELTTPHIPEMLAAKQWKCAVCKKDAETLLLHPMPMHLAGDPPLLNDFGGIAVCGSRDCHDSAADMMQTLYKQVMESAGLDAAADGGIIEVY